MAKSVAEADKKSINLAQEIYVHYNKQNYLDYKRQHNLVIDIKKSLNNIYMGYADIAAKSMSELRKFTNKDGQNIVDMLGLINEISGKSNVYTDMSNEITTKIADIIRSGISKSIQAGTALNKTTDVQKQLNIIDQYLAYLKDALDIFSQGNEDLFNYILSKYESNSNVKNNINKIFSTGNRLNLLAINKTSLTSYNNLSKKIELLENVKNSLGTAKKKGTINYNGKSKTYSSFIYSLSQPFINILGGIGEGYGAIYALTTLEDFLKTLDSKDMKVTIEGTGTEKIAGKSTKKADYEISINDANGEISFNFGISAKAQSLKKGKPVTTTFESNTVENILKKYTKLTNIEKYIFYNDLYANITNTAETQYLRRKIAAQAMFDAVTGGNQQENVLFLQYLDELVSLDDFFSGLAKMPESQLPTFRIFGGSKLKNSKDFIVKRGAKFNKLWEEEYYKKDLTPEDKSIVAWVRSRQVIKTINQLSAQIQYKH